MQRTRGDEKKRLRGKLTVPGDKSISHRALILGSIADGATRITGFLNSADCISTLRAFSAMGVEVDNISDTEIVVQGRGLHGLSKPGRDIDAGNSGTTMRLISGILAGQEFLSTITGDESLMARPMDRIIIPLKEMGADIKGVNNKYPPITINGSRLHSIDFKMPVASAQVKSCILLAGLYASGETSVTEPHKSRDHTEKMLEYMGADVEVNGLKVVIHPKDKLTAGTLNIPGDPSSAAFFIVAALISDGSDITINGVGINDTRTGLIAVLKRMGADISFENKRKFNNEPVADIHVRSSALRGVRVEGEIIPRLIDEIPVLAVAATKAVGKTEIRGVGELRVKETDRLSAICSELTKMGALVNESEAGLTIEGPVELTGAEVDSYGDHRMAMALTIAGLVAKGKTIITKKECVDISFPGFYKTLSSVTDIDGKV